MHTREEQLKAIDRLLTILDELREKCPWDKKQTFNSLRSLTLEEVYELTDSIEIENYDDLKKELGDVLMHIFFYAKIGSEQNLFDIKEVADSISDKLIYRHPHIYGNTIVNDENDVEQNWEKLKLKEGNKSVLSGVPKGLPSIIKAYRIQQKASGVGFDWESKEEVWNKVQEEIIEFQLEEKDGNLTKMEQEFGDILFSLVNYARFVGIDPDKALSLTNDKFIKRFQDVEKSAVDIGSSIANLSSAEMNQFWEEAKKKQ